MDNRNLSRKLSTIIDSCVDDLLKYSDEEIDILFAEQYTAHDLESIKYAAQSAITKQRKLAYSMITPPVSNSAIARIHQKISGFSKEKIEEILHVFFSSPASAQIGVAFRNESAQSNNDRASLLADLALNGLINLDAEIH